MARSPTIPALPKVPEPVAYAGSDEIHPWPEMDEWARAVLIDPAGPLANEEHRMIGYAQLRFCVTNVPNTRRGRMIIGTAELGAPPASRSKWEKARARALCEEWWELVPDFIITLSGPYLEAAARYGNAAAALALIEHELYHCAHDGFTVDGDHKWRIVGHDVEEFVGVVQRYGAAASGPSTIALVEAAVAGPEIAAAELRGICGTASRAA